MKKIFLSLCAVMLLFPVLKLTHVIAWNWWAVLSPLWITLIIWFAANIIINCVPLKKTRDDDGWDHYK